MTVIPFPARRLARPRTRRHGWLCVPLVGAVLAALLATGMPSKPGGQPSPVAPLCKARPGPGAC